MERKEWRQDVMRDFEDDLKELRITSDEQMEELLLLAEALEDTELDEEDGRRKARRRISVLQGGEKLRSSEKTRSSGRVRESDKPRGSDKLKESDDNGWGGVNKGSSASSRRSNPPDKASKPSRKGGRREKGRDAPVQKLDRTTGALIVLCVMLAILSLILLVLLLNERRQWNPSVPDETPGVSMTQTLPEASPTATSDQGANSSAPESESGLPESTFNPVLEPPLARLHPEWSPFPMGLLPNSRQLDPARRRGNRKRTHEAETLTL